MTDTTSWDESVALAEARFRNWMERRGYRAERTVGTELNRFYSLNYWTVWKVWRGSRYARIVYRVRESQIDTKEHYEAWTRAKSELLTRIIYLDPGYDTY